MADMAMVPRPNMQTYDLIRGPRTSSTAIFARAHLGSRQCAWSNGADAFIDVFDAARFVPDLVAT